MSAPDRKYTDADVRSDPELTELAYEYLDTYCGDFEPLVKAQDVIRAGRPLTVTLTRVVLNCMRHDWDIADQLPQPIAKVIEMPVRDEAQPKRKKRNYGYQGERYCNKLWTVLHKPHNWSLEPVEDDRDYYYCPGRNNGREEYLWINARIKTPYAKARGGKMIHLVAPDGSNFRWITNRYGPGFSRFSPSLGVNLLCRYPSRLTEPLLLWEIPDGLITNDGTPIGLCPHCEKVRDGSN